MLGMRNATRKASVIPPAPKASATTMSRTKPSTRLVSVAALIDPSARTTWCSARAPAAALTLQFLPYSGMMQRARHTTKE